MKKQTTKKDLLKQIRVMQLFGDDLVAAIENACWLDDKEKPNLHGLTYHMRNAVRMWRDCV